MSDFFAMGGYAAYVWPAYGASVLVLAAVTLLIWRRGRELKKRLEKFEAETAKQADGADA